MSVAPSDMSLRHRVARVLPVLLLAGGLSAAGALPAAAAKKPPAPVKTVVINEGTVSLGPILTTVQGFTLYRDSLDTATASNCTGTCLVTWPPVLLPIDAKAAKAGKGVHQNLLGTFVRTDLPGDPRQVTYNGSPLYRYIADFLTKGLTNGQGKGGKWFVVSPA